MAHFVRGPNSPHRLEWNERHGWVFPSRVVYTGAADLGHYVSFQVKQTEETAEPDLFDYLGGNY